MAAGFSARALSTTSEPADTISERKPARSSCLARSSAAAGSSSTTRIRGNEAFPLL